MSVIEIVLFPLYCSTFQYDAAFAAEYWKVFGTMNWFYIFLQHRMQKISDLDFWSGDLVLN